MKLNVFITCSVCGKQQNMELPQPVSIDNVYELFWKKFLMRGWHRIPKTDYRTNPPSYTNEYCYFCPECGGR